MQWKLGLYRGYIGDIVSFGVDLVTGAGATNKEVECVRKRSESLRQRTELNGHESFENPVLHCKDSSPP